GHSPTTSSLCSCPVMVLPQTCSVGALLSLTILPRYLDTASGRPALTERSWPRLYGGYEPGGSSLSSTFVTPMLPIETYQTSHRPTTSPLKALVHPGRCASSCWEGVQNPSLQAQQYGVEC